MINPMVYYELNSFYGNYRSFVKSKDVYQLRGKEKSLSTVKKCIGAQSYTDLMWDVWFSAQEKAKF
jgi:hypothetical protein